VANPWGLLVDIQYIAGHCFFILAISGAVLLMSSLLSAIAFRLLGMTWSDSLWSGALLSQTGQRINVDAKYANAG